LQTGYITLNTRVPPFDNVKVRQAINMAINKERIVRIINGRAVVANQPLPPLMPGYDTTSRAMPMTSKAPRRCSPKAGLPTASTPNSIYNTDPQPRIAQAIQQDLAAIGVKAEIKSLAQANVIEAGGEGSAPMIWSGGMAWIADFPDPSNFYGPILGCAGAVRAAGTGLVLQQGSRCPGDCRRFDGRSGQGRRTRADVAQDLHRHDGRCAVGAGVQRAQRFTVRSERMGGAGCICSSTRSIFPVNYDYVFAKDVQ
jgi:hypothetical protein